MRIQSLAWGLTRSVQAATGAFLAVRLALGVKVGPPPVSTAGLVLALTLTGPAQAQTAQSPEEVVDAYYRAVDSGDCETATRLRPGYSKVGCRAVAEVRFWQSRVVKREADQAAVFLKVVLLRSGSDAPVDFIGFALLQRSGESWILLTKSFKSATDGYQISEYLNEYLPAPGLDPVAALDLPADPADAVDPPSGAPLADDPLRSDLPAEHLTGDPVPRDARPTDLLSGEPLARDLLASDPVTRDPLARDPVTGTALAGGPSDALPGDPTADDPLSGSPPPVRTANGGNGSLMDPGFLGGTAPATAPLPDVPADSGYGTAPPQDTDDAVQIFLSYYDALHDQDCDFALSLRPGENLDRCRSVTEVLQSQATAETRIGDDVILRVKVALRRRDGDGLDQLEDFQGFVTVSRRDFRWEIVHGSYASVAPGTLVDAYVRKHGIGAPVRSQIDDAVLAAMVPDAGVPQDMPQPTMSYWAYGGPTTFGSQAVLDACWSGGQLAAHAGEEKTRKTGTGAWMGDPARTVPQRTLPRLQSPYLDSIRRVDTGGRKVVALTFDTGEQNNDFAGYDGEIYDYLRSQNVKATFYFGGKWLATHPTRAMQIIADPLFEPGNHAWTHGNMRVLTGQDALDQILFTQAQYELLLEELWRRPCAQTAGAEAFGRIPPVIPTFRYPYGTCSAETLDMVNDAGLPAVQWDVVTADPVKKQSGKAIAEVVMRKVQPGSIVIMHSNGRGWNTPDALPIFIPELRAEGYEFVTVSELLEMGTPVTRRECYEQKPGDNTHYDRIFGRGTGD